MAWCLYNIEHPLLRGLVIRKNADDLKDWLDRARRMFSGQGVIFKGNPAIIIFPSGARYYTGHLRDENAFTKYQGHEYQRILVEELTQIPSEDLYLKLLSSCRSTVPELKARFFGTTNPGGVGHHWVKRRFVDPTTPGNIYTDPISKRERIYIPATVDDNPTLKEADPGYVTFLESLAPDLRAQWRYGSWDQVAFKGQVYGDEIKHAQQQGRVYDFYPDEFRKTYAVFDLGKTQADLMSIGFVQTDKTQLNIIDYHESFNKKWSFYSNLILEKDFKCKDIILPHDGAKRDGETLKSMKDFFEEQGFNVEIVPRTNSIPNDIQIVKTVFPRCHFAALGTARLLEALEQYRYKWDEEKDIPSNEPIHDWTSHPADMFRMLCVHFQELKGLILETKVEVDQAWRESDVI